MDVGTFLHSRIQWILGSRRHFHRYDQAPFRHNTPRGTIWFIPDLGYFFGYLWIFIEYNGIYSKMRTEKGAGFKIKTVFSDIQTFGINAI